MEFAFHPDAALVHQARKVGSKCPRAANWSAELPPKARVIVLARQSQTI